MASRTVKVEIVGDSSDAERAFHRVGAAADAMQTHVVSAGKKMQGWGKDLSTHVTAPIVAGLGLAMKAASDEDQQIAILDKTIKNNVTTTREQRAEIGRQITAWQNTTGILDDKLRPAYANLIRATKDVGQANGLMVTAMDIAKARGLDVEVVTKAMARAHDGNVGALGRLGIATKDVNGKTLTFEQVMANAAKTYGGTAAAAANTTAGRLQILRARFSDLIEDLGRIFMPILEKMVGWISKLADQFGSLSPSMQQFAVIAAVVLAALGPIVGIIGTLITVIGAVISPVGLVVAAIAALAVGFVIAYQRSETFRDIVDGVVAWLRDVAWPVIQNVARWIGEQFGKLVEWTREHWTEIKTTVQTAINDVRVIVETVVELIQTGWDLFGQFLIDKASNAWALVKSQVEAGIQLVKGVIDLVMGIIEGDWGRVWDGMKEIAGGIWDGIKGLFETGWKEFKAVFDFGLLILKAGWNAVWGTFESVASGIWGGIKSGFQAAVNWIIDYVINPLIRAYNNTIGRLPGTPGMDELGQIGDGGGSYEEGIRSGRLSGPPSQRKAIGGPVAPFMPYLVGERGPELFVPFSRGTIIPNMALGGSNTVVINVTVPAGLTLNEADRLGRTVGRSASSELRAVLRAR